MHTRMHAHKPVFIPYPTAPPFFLVKARVLLSFSCRLTDHYSFSLLKPEYVPVPGTQHEPTHARTARTNKTRHIASWPRAVPSRRHIKNGPTRDLDTYTTIRFSPIHRVDCLVADNLRLQLPVQASNHPWSWTRVGTRSSLRLGRGNPNTSCSLSGNPPTGTSLVPTFQDLFPVVEETRRTRAE
jgi:hypothetical protein